MQGESHARRQELNLLNLPSPCAWVWSGNMEVVYTIMIQYFTIYVKWWTNELIKEDNITIQIWLQKYISVVMYNHTKNIYTLLRMLCDTPILSINRSIIMHSTVHTLAYCHCSTLAGLGHPSEWVQKQILQNILGRVQDLLSNCVVFYKLCNIVIATMLKTINVH